MEFYFGVFEYDVSRGHVLLATEPPNVQVMHADNVRERFQERLLEDIDVDRIRDGLQQNHAGFLHWNGKMLD